MAAAKGNDEHVKTDKEWNAHLMCKLSGMLTKANFRDLKQVFLMTERVPLRDIDEISDFIPFWAKLERLDHISVGRYGVLIQHLEMLQLNECIRVIKEHTQKIEEYRQRQSSRRAPSSGAEGPVPSSSNQTAKPRAATRTQARYVAPPSADINKVTYGDTQLTLAAKENDLASVRNLIEAGADVDIKGGWWGITALIFASEKGHTEVVAELIKAGADVNIQTVVGMTALRFAEANGYSEIVRMLKEASARR